MADPTLTNSASGTSTSASTNASFGFTGTSGRLLVLTVGSDDYKTGDPSGWTLSNEMSQQTFLGSYVWWKVSDGTETSVTYVIGSASGSAWTITEYDNINASPYDDSQGQFAQSAGGTYTTPTIVPTSGRRLLLAVIGGSSTTNWTGLSTWLNSFTETKESFQNTGSTKDITGIAMLVVDGDGSTSFSSGATYGGSPQSRTGHILSFKVAGGSLVPPPSRMAHLIGR